MQYCRRGCGILDLDSSEIVAQIASKEICIHQLAVLQVWNRSLQSWNSQSCRLEGVPSHELIHLRKQLLWVRLRHADAGVHSG